MKNTDIFLQNKQKIVEVNNKLKEIMFFSIKLVLYLEKFKYPAEISIFLTDDENIKNLNLKYRKKNSSTDVLSFPTFNNGKYFNYDEKIVLGDIIISVEKAKSQFRKYFSSCFEEEIARLIIHSMLHLLGYDHEKGEKEKEIMRKKEKILNNVVKCKFKFERVNYYEN